jgi:DNA polymerase
VSLPFTHIACVDFETFYSDEYTLKKLSTTDYIRDDRFEAQSCAIYLDDNEVIVAAGYDEIVYELGRIDWSTTAFLGHHTQFDGLIATHHFGVYPCFWLDTMSMARMAFGVDSSVSLKALTERLGRPGKVHGQALVDVKGKHLADLSEEALDALLEYNADDVEDTRWIFDKMRPFVPDEELALIDITVRMYAEPTLLIDGERVARVYEQERTRKAELFERIGLDVKELGSAPKFAAQLEALGVDPPRKVSIRTGKIAYAFSKQDYEFKGLLEHPDDRVRWLVEARLASKSSLVETRSESILRRVGRPTPIYLNYYGARTGRWSGGDGVNWQNLPRRGLGSELRKSLVAPDGHLLVISDASQIEARTLAWHAGQDDIVEAFANNVDVYCLAASVIFGRTITKADAFERFVGKVFVLGAGYGAGAAKINYMLKIGAFGPVVKQLMEETEDFLNTWRASNKFITKDWKSSNQNARTAFLNLTEVDDGVVIFEGTKRGGYIHLPNGAYIFYPNISMSEDGKDMMYVTRNGPVKLYGGIIVENIIQSLARVILGQQMLVMQEEMPDMRIATTTHDEVVEVVPKKKAEEYKRITHRIMSTAPAWATGLPLNAETHVSEIYDKS